MKVNHTRKFKRKSGLSLVEIMFAISILGVVVAGVMPMYVQSSKILMSADTKLDVNDEIRKTTDQMVAEAREADAFLLYDNYKGAWIDGDFVNFRSDAFHGLGRLRDGESGKFLVLLFYGVDPYPDDSTPAPIEKIIGIYLDADETQDTGPVRMFLDEDLDSELAIEENLPSVSKMGTHDIIIDEMTGLLDEDIFYNFGGSSIMLSGKIKESNGSQIETNLYNFTVTPR